MIKPFGVKSRDWETFNEHLHGKFIKLQNKECDIKEVKYSTSVLQFPDSNIFEIEYSAIIIYDDGKSIINR